MDALHVRCNNERNRERNHGWPTVFAGVLGGVWLLGCSDAKPVPVAPTVETVYQSLQFNFHAVNLAVVAPYNTIQLTATARTASGAALSTTGTVQYTTTDSTVSVNPAGLVTAHFATGSVPVVARLSVNGVTHTDTAFVRVTPTPLSAPLTTFSIQPQSDGLDSARRALDSFGAYLPVYATIATGDAVTDTICNVNSCSLLVDLRTSDPGIINISDGFIYLNSVGQAKVYASTVAYGVIKQDSLPFTVSYPTGSLAILRIDRRSDSRQTVPLIVVNRITVGVGARVRIVNSIPDSIEVRWPQTPAIRLLFHGPDLQHQLTDTIPPNSSPFDWAFGFDSVGTYTMHAKVLRTGATADATVIVSRGP